MSTYSAFRIWAGSIRPARRAGQYAASHRSRWGEERWRCQFADRAGKRRRRGCGALSYSTAERRDRWLRPRESAALITATLAVRSPSRSAMSRPCASGIPRSSNVDANQTAGMLSLRWFDGIEYWALKDSNLRPRACEARAL